MNKKRGHAEIKANLDANHITVRDRVKTLLTIPEYKHYLSKLLMDELKITAKNYQQRKCTVHSELRYYCMYNTIYLCHSKMVIIFKALHNKQQEC